MALITSGTAYVDTDAGTDDASHGETSGSGACATLAYLVANRIGTLTGPLAVDCHGATADTTQPDIGNTALGVTSTNTLTIRANTADRAGMGWNTGKYRLSVTGAVGCRIREDYVIFDGLQLEMTPNAAAGFFADTGRSSTDVTIVKNCVLKGDGSATYRLTPGGAVTIYYFINCLFYNFGGNASSFLLCEYGDRYFYSCTAIMASGAGYGVRNDGASSVVVKNTYVGGAGGNDYMGTITGDYNIASDTTASGKFTHYKDSEAINTTNFVDVTIDGGEDWRVPAGSALIDAGADTSGEGAPLNFTSDLLGTTRSGTWDVGAYEYVSAASMAGMILSGRVMTGLTLGGLLG